MNEPLDPESTDKDAGGDADGAAVPWNLPTDEEESAEQAHDPVALGGGVDPEPVVSDPLQTDFLKVRCPACEQELNISRDHLGMQGECLNCSLPIVARMTPVESGVVAVEALEVLVTEEESAPDEVDVSVASGEDEAVTNEVQPEIPVPSWMKDSLKADSIIAQESDADLDSELETGSVAAAEAQEAEIDVASESVEEDGVELATSVEAVTSEDESSPQDQADEKPSWSKGGNPWDALGLSEKKEDEVQEVEGAGVDAKDDDVAESPEVEQQEEENGETELAPLVLSSEKAEKTEEDGVQAEDELDEEAVLDDQEESRRSLVIAALIILAVGGGGWVTYLVRSNGNSQDKPVTGEVAKPADSKPPGESGKSPGSEGGKKAPGAAEAGTGVAKSSVGASGNNSQPSGSANQTPDKKEPLVDNKKPPAGSKIATSNEPKPKMATATAEVHDEVALRIHQEGERAIRRFYSAPSVEERSAFVLDPGRVMDSMRAFYGKKGQLPTLRYIEFKGKLQDPASGLRFGVFDVYEKENEESHRWCVVEIEPGQFALDWGFYEQLENSALVSYLSEVQAEARDFRFLMKLGDSLSAVDSPWNEETVKVYLQLPLAGGGGGEVILVRKSEAEKFGILEELADGQMKIGQVKLGWIPGDKDPGSKVPSITGIKGWGAWSKDKMRGL